MANLPSATYSAPGVPLYQPFGGSVSNLSTFTADSFTFQSASESNTKIEFDTSLSTQTGISFTTGSNGGAFGSIVLDATNSNLVIGSLGYVQMLTPLSTGVITTSSINAATVDVDGQVLTANPTDLLLNGVPLATTSNISSIADWAFDPAVSTVNMALNDLVSTKTGSFSTINVDTIYASTVYFQQEIGISSFVSSISSVKEYVDELNVSSISSGTINTGLLWGQPSSFYQGGFASNLSSLNLSTLTVGEFISVPLLNVSSINGSEFTSTGITVQVAGVSSLVANSISSIGAELKNAFVSTLQFNAQANFDPVFKVDLGLGNFLGGLVGGAGSGVFNTTLAGAALATGITALTLPRGNAAGWSPNLNSNVFETVNGTTQLQISTLGVDVSTIYRLVSSSGAADVVPGTEVFVSTIVPAGTPCIRSFSDPIYLASPSTQTSSIQAFGQWVPLPDAGIQSSFSTLFTSTLGFGISSILHGRDEFPEVSVLNPSTLSTGQFLANVFRCSPAEGSGLSLGYTQRVTDNRALVVDSNVSTHALAYTVDSNVTFNNLSVSSITSYISDLNYVPIKIDSAGSFINIDAGGPITIDTAASGSSILINPVDAVLIGGGGELYVSSIQQLSSINGVAYPPPAGPTVSSFNTASVSSLSVSSVNGGIPYTTANPPPGGTVSTFNTASVSSLTVSSVNGGIPYTTANPQPAGPLISSFTNLFTQNLAASTINTTNGQLTGISSINGINFNSFTPGSGVFSTLTVSSIQALESSILMNNSFGGNSFSLNSGGDVIGIASNGYVNFQVQNTAGTIGGLIINNSAGGGTNVNLYASTVNVSTGLMRVSSISSAVVSLSNLNFTGVSSINFSTAGSAGTASQPIGRLLMSGCDLDLQQNDLWCQQVRIGAGNPSGSAQSELIFYDPATTTQRALNIGGSDRTIRIQSTINSSAGGYLLDTQLNPPLFSTINGTSTALVSYFPSTAFGSIGYSTISLLPPINYFASAYNSTSQTVTGANTSTVALLNTTALNVGGFTVGTSSIGVPVGGTYELNASFQFATSSGGANLVQFWLTKNGAAVAQTNSQVTVANNADNLGTISIFDQANAGDQYGWMFYSADASMFASAVAAGATPAIPSLIFNIKRLG